MPTRIQRKRTPGWRVPLDAQGRKPVYVGRRPGSRWHNPFAVGDPHPDPGENGRPIRDRAEAVELFRLHTGWGGLYEYDADKIADLRRELAGRDLMCWCDLPEPGEPDHCHAAVLLALVAALPA